MFGLFKKKHQQLPSFPFLEDHPHKNKYFVRTMQWDWLNDKMIYVVDNNAPRMITMDEWPQQIYLDADGQKTIAEYVVWMAKQYGSGQIPLTLDKDMIQQMEGLVKDGELIQLKDAKTALPYYLDGPKSEQDKDKAYKMMVKDGYLEG